MAKINFEEFKSEDFAVDEADIAAADDTTGFVDPKTIDTAAEHAQAVVLLSNLPNVPVRSGEFDAIVEAVEKFGADEVRLSSMTTNGLLSRSTGKLTDSKKSSREVTLKSLADLRSVVDELGPTEGLFSPRSKLMRFIPGSNRVRKYIQKFESSSSHLEGIVDSLNSSKDGILRDNGEILAEKEQMANSLQPIAKKTRELKFMKDVIKEQANELERMGDTTKAQVLRTEVLHVIQQREQDLTTQFTVNAQAFMSLDLIHKNNKELIKGVDRAKHVTVTALRNAVMTAAALDEQKQVSDKLTALKSGTESLMLSNAEMLKSNSTAIYTQASEAAISPEVIEKSFQAIHETFEAIDNYKRNSGEVMEATTKRLEDQMAKAQNRFEESAMSHLAEKQKQQMGELSRG